MLFRLCSVLIVYCTFKLQHYYWLNLDLPFSEVILVAPSGDHLISIRSLMHTDLYSHTYLCLCMTVNKEQVMRVHVCQGNAANNYDVEYGPT